MSYSQLNNVEGRNGHPYDILGFSRENYFIPSNIGKIYDDEPNTIITHGRYSIGPNDSRNYPNTFTEKCFDHLTNLTILGVGVKKNDNFQDTTTQGPTMTLGSSRKRSSPEQSENMSTWTCVGGERFHHPCKKYKYNGDE